MRWNNFSAKECFSLQVQLKLQKIFCLRDGDTAIIKTLRHADGGISQRFFEKQETGINKRKRSFDQLTNFLTKLGNVFLRLKTSEKIILSI